MRYVSLLLAFGIFLLLITGDRPSVSHAAGSDLMVLHTIEGTEKTHRYVKEEILVKFNADITLAQASQAISEMGYREEGHYAQTGIRKVQLSPGQNVADAVRSLKSDPTVEYAEPNYIVRALPVTPMTLIFLTNGV